MTRIAVIVATTNGPVRVERITRERAPQSMVCLQRSSTVLPISAAYDSFVRLGSGIIERVFGPFEEGSFRLDVSAPIDSGKSWQLGFFFAHALCAMPDSRLAGTEENAESVAWLSGHLDYDLAVGSVGHIAEKVHASRAAIAGWLAAGRPVTMFVHEGPDYEAAMAAGVPEGARLVPVRSAQDVLSAFDLLLPNRAPLVRTNAPPSRRSVGIGTSVQWLAAGLGVLAITTVMSMSQTPSSPIPGVSQQIPAPKPTVLPSAVSPERPSTTGDRTVVPETPDRSQSTAAIEVPKLTILERRAPPGHTCAEVQFGLAKALEVSVPPAGANPSTSALQGLCGLGVAIDNGTQAQFVAIVLEIVQGKLLSGTVRPDQFGGQVLFGGQREWPIDLPRRLAEPFEIRVVAIGGKKPVSEEAGWFRLQPDGAAAVKELSAKGIGTSELRHRVLP